MGYQYNLGFKFYDVADRYASNIALQYPTGVTYSYEHLNKLSNKFARYLLSKKIVKGNVVAIFNEKSVYAFSLMLGCLKIGAIYSNLDTVSPWYQ